LAGRRQGSKYSQLKLKLFALKFFLLASESEGQQEKEFVRRRRELDHDAQPNTAKWTQHRSKIYYHWKHINISIIIIDLVLEGAGGAFLSGAGRLL